MTVGVVEAVAEGSADLAAAIPEASGLPAVGKRRGDNVDELKELLSKLERAFSGRLVSVVLYGSAASGSHHDKLADLNVLCVLKEITPQELADGEPVLKWWRDKGHPSPLLMSEEEVHNSADSFPIEFLDMKERRKVLFGVDSIGEVHVDTKYHRVQVEHELRAKLFRLRQQAAQVLSDPQKLLTLCVDSVGTFCVLGRHALLAAGREAKHDRRAVVAELESALKLDMSPFRTLLDIREDKPGDPGDPGELFAQYLQCIRGLVEFVDRLEGQI
jgi:predicted nucleotidyltransferase